MVQHYRARRFGLDYLPNGPALNHVVVGIKTHVDKLTPEAVKLAFGTDFMIVTPTGLAKVHEYECDKVEESEDGSLVLEFKIDYRPSENWFCSIAVSLMDHSIEDIYCRYLSISDAADFPVNRVISAYTDGNRHGLRAVLYTTWMLKRFEGSFIRMFDLQPEMFEEIDYQNASLEELRRVAPLRMLPKESNSFELRQMMWDAEVERHSFVQQVREQMLRGFAEFAHMVGCTEENLVELFEVYRIMVSIPGVFYL
jgi:hypothetical protein